MLSAFIPFITYERDQSRVNSNFVSRHNSATTLERHQAFMQDYFISIAFIRDFQEEKPYWLGLWDPKLRWFKFPSAVRLESESYRETITREVAWELGLDRKRDFLVSNMAQLNHQFIGQIPESAQREVAGEENLTAAVGSSESCNIVVAFYPIHLYGKQARQIISGRDDVRWLTSDEICAGRTDNHKLIDPFQFDLIQRTRVIQHWEST
jgi:hypothetical protein